MATKTQLSEWLIDNCHSINLKVTNCKWVNSWIPGFFDVSSNITVDGVTFEGRGCDTSEHLAFTKSGAEAIERAAKETFYLR